MYWIKITTIVLGNGQQSSPAYNEGGSSGPFSSRADAERALIGLLSAGRVVAAEVFESDE